MPQRPEEQPPVVIRTKPVNITGDLVDVLKRGRPGIWTPGQTDDAISYNRAMLGEGKRQNDLKGGQNTFPNDTGALNLRGTDPKMSNRGTLESTAPATPSRPPPATKTTPGGSSFRLSSGYQGRREEKNGGLTAARQHVVPDFFPGQLDQLKLGPMRVQPIAFMGASPQINLRTVAFQGFLRNRA